MPCSPMRFELGPDAGDLLPGRDGWALWRPGRRNVEVLVHLVEVRKELVIDTLVVHRADGVAGVDLRELPLVRLGAALKLKPVSTAVASAAGSRSAPRLVTGTSIPVEGLSGLADRYPAHSLGPARSLRLRIPAGRVKDRAFYWQVLDLYEALQLDSHRPAAEIAAANGVTPIKVHQWVKQARERVDQEVARGHDDLSRYTRQVRAEEDDERSWQDELNRRLDAFGMSWEEYWATYDQPGDPDPIGAWDDEQRSHFLESSRSPESDA